MSCEEIGQSEAGRKLGRAGWAPAGNKDLVRASTIAKGLSYAWGRLIF
jgi:hypothetical protein